MNVNAGGLPWFSTPSLGHLIRIAVFLTIVGCAAYTPRPMTEVPFLERAQTKGDERVKVMVSVLDKHESKEVFGVNLAGKGIQPVWLEIENNDSVPYWLALSHLDPNYYSPAEAAYKSRFTLSKSANKNMEDYFNRLGIRHFVPPRGVVSGFIFSNMDHGTKEVNVTLLGPKKARWFTFFVFVPGIETDYHEVDFDALYPPDKIVSHDLAGLKTALEELPCCATNEDGTGMADPLNLVFNGDIQNVFGALIRSGWSETETLSARTGWKTLKSFLFSSKYFYSPVSPLYVFGRPQDVAFQKARETINERNHLRLWLTPMRYEEKPVWIGQISRDIGVKFTNKTWYFLTHKIDPNIDADRWYLIQDLISSEGIANIGYVRGVGAAPMSTPRTNLTDDTYFTDGLRAVLIFSDRPVSYSELHFTDPSALLTSKLMGTPFKSSSATPEMKSLTAGLDDDHKTRSLSSEYEGEDTGQQNFYIRMKGFAFTSGLTPNKRGLPDGRGDGITEREWCGSGFLAAKDGTVVTGYDIARRAGSGTVVFSDGRTYDIKDIRLYDPESGIAALQVNADKEFANIKFGNSDDVNIMDRVRIVGSAACEKVNISEGTIQDIKKNDRNEKYRLQYSSSVHTGYKGEAVYTGDRIIGINIDRYLIGDMRNAIPVNIVRHTLSEQSESALSLTDRFSRDIELIISKSHLIYVHNGQLPAASKNKPQIQTYATEFYPSEDYIIFVQARDGDDPAVSVYDWQGNLTGFGDRRDEDFDIVLISGQNFRPVYIQVINYDRIPFNYALEIHKIDW